MLHSSNRGTVVSRAFLLGVLTVVLAVPAHASSKLRTALNEYQSVSRELKRGDYREWIDRLNRLIASDQNASTTDVYTARRVQVALSNGLSEWEESVKYADEAVRLASSPEVAFSAGFSAASAAMYAYYKTPSAAMAERVLKRLTDLQEQVERPGGLLERSTEIRNWGPRYVNVLMNRAKFLAERDAHSEALALYEKSLELMSAGRIPAVEPAGPRAREEAMYRAMVCAARCKDRARSEELLIQLHRMPDLASDMIRYVEELARTEDPSFGPAYQERMAWWVDRTEPTDPSWALALFELALSQGRKNETTRDAVNNWMRLLAAYETRPAPQGINWPVMRNECWWQLARAHANYGSGVFDLSKARRFADLYIEATKADGAESYSKRMSLEQAISAADPKSP